MQIKANFGSARTQIEAAVQLKPDFAEAHDLLGGLYENGGSVEKAVAEYREAVRRHLDLGAALLPRDRSAAVEQFRLAAQDGDPAIRQQPGQAMSEIGR